MPCLYVISVVSALISADFAVIADFSVSSHTQDVSIKDARNFVKFGLPECHP